MSDFRRVYNTQRWKTLRQLIYDRDGGICYFCHKLVTKRPNIHHLIEVDETNYQDENIMWNPDNLVTCHSWCHNEHHERFGYSKKIVNDDLSINYERRKA